MVNLGVWGMAGVVIGGFHARRSLVSLGRIGRLTRLRRFETGGAWYRTWTRVHRWKDLVPDAGGWFGGLSKRRLPAVVDGGWARFELECLRAERTHWGMLGLTPAFAIWNTPSWFAANVAFAIVINVPCLVIVRYNRCRVVQLVARQSRVT